MSRYKNVKVNIWEVQMKNLQDTIQTGGPVSIRFSYEDLNANAILVLTKSLMNKLNKACESGKGTTIKWVKLN